MRRFGCRVPGVVVPEALMRRRVAPVVIRHLRRRLPRHSGGRGARRRRPEVLRGHGLQAQPRADISHELLVEIVELHHVVLGGHDVEHVLHAELLQGRRGGQLRRIPVVELTGIVGVRRKPIAIEHQRHGPRLLARAQHFGEERLIIGRRAERQVSADHAPRVRPVLEGEARIERPSEARSEGDGQRARQIHHHRRLRAQPVEERGQAFSRAIGRIHLRRDDRLKRVAERGGLDRIALDDRRWQRVGRLEQGR